MKKLCLATAVIAAIGLAVAGFVRGTYAAGGSDSSCYALMAEAFADGVWQPSSPLAARVPWPDASKTFTPGGFVPSQRTPLGFAPVCAPGFALLLAPVVKVGGREALFYVTPMAGALLVVLAFVAAQRLGGPVAGVMASVLVAASPTVLYQVVQPMNDVTTAALWMAVFVALLSRRWALAGACCGLALLVRPNLLPLGLIAGGYVILADPIPNPQSRIPRAARFAVTVLPFALVVLWLNSQLYGGPFRSGYGQPASLFALSNVPANARNYLDWLVETQTLFPLLALAAPFTCDRDRRPAAMLALGFIVATLSVYFVYRPFDDWSYLRFLLPALALMLVLASVVTTGLAGRLFPRAVPLVVGVITAGLLVLSARTADDRLAFDLQALEQRYRSAGVVVRDQLPAGAVVLSVWDSGAVRFHGRKEALAWEGLDPAWLDRALEWLTLNGHRPYIMVESWEEPAFRSRFGSQSDIGKLDWPPKYEIDRVVRIYDPVDRARYQNGERIVTEYHWPFGVTEN